MKNYEMKELCLSFFKPDNNTWISRGDYYINAKAYISVEKSETDKIEVIKKVLERYTTWSAMSYKEFLDCFEYHGFDVRAINESELNQNYKIIVGNEEDFYVELEWIDYLGDTFELLVKFRCFKNMKQICEKNVIPKEKLELKEFKVYDEHKMEAYIKVKKYDEIKKDNEYFMLKNIFNMSEIHSLDIIKWYLQIFYNYEIIFGKINKEYEEEYNYLMENSKYYKMDCTLIESYSEAILKINFKHYTVK